MRGKMLNKLILLTCAVACVFAAPSTDVIPLERQQPTVIPIVSQSEELEPNGTYKFSYETGNGIKREEEAYEKILPSAKSQCASSEECSNSDESNEIHVQKGSYSYVAPDGTLISVSYIADENGFQPIGTHINVAPVGARSSVSLSEKSGRALKALDSSKSASAPAIAKVAEQSSAPVVPETKSTPTEQAPDANNEAVSPSESIQPAETPASESGPESSTIPAAESTQAAETPAPESEPELKTTIAAESTQAAETPALESESELKTTVAAESTQSAETPAPVSEPELTTLASESTQAAETPAPESELDTKTTLNDQTTPAAIPEAGTEVPSAPAAETPNSEAELEQKTTPSIASESEPEPTTSSIAESSVTEVESQPENVDKSNESTTSNANESPETSTVVVTEQPSTKLADAFNSESEHDSPSEATEVPVSTTS